MLNANIALAAMRLAETVGDTTGTSAVELTTGQQIVNGLMTFGLPVLMLLGLYFLMIRPQKKEQKKRQEERNSLQVGDNIVTIGGIVGRVVNIKDNEITISTSVAKTMMTFRKEAIDQVIKPVSDES